MKIDVSLRECDLRNVPPTSPDIRKPGLCHNVNTILERYQGKLDGVSLYFAPSADKPTPWWQDFVREFTKENA